MKIFPGIINDVIGQVMRGQSSSQCETAVLIGVFIPARPTFAAEVGRCQAECGSSSGKAAAALVTIAGAPGYVRSHIKKTL